MFSSMFSSIDVFINGLFDKTTAKLVALAQKNLLPFSRIWRNLTKMVMKNAQK